MTTKLKRGIKVKIDPLEFEELKKELGFLPSEHYPDFYKEISDPNELGRFLIFRFYSHE